MVGNLNRTPLALGFARVCYLVQTMHDYKISMSKSMTNYRSKLFFKIEIRLFVDGTGLQTTLLLTYKKHFPQNINTEHLQVKKKLNKFPN